LRSLILKKRKKRSFILKKKKKNRPPLRMNYESIDKSLMSEKNTIAPIGFITKDTIFATKNSLTY
jgi:hypothetical protein